jgi:hypothetical protein
MARNRNFDQNFSGIPNLVDPLPFGQSLHLRRHSQLQCRRMGMHQYDSDSEEETWSDWKPPWHFDQNLQGQPKKRSEQMRSADEWH